MVDQIIPALLVQLLAQGGDLGEEEEDEREDRDEGRDEELLSQPVVEEVEDFKPDLEELVEDRESGGPRGDGGEEEGEGAVEGNGTSPSLVYL